MLGDRKKYFWGLGENVSPQNTNDAPPQITHEKSPKLDCVVTVVCVKNWFLKTTEVITNYTIGVLW